MLKWASAEVKQLWEVHAPYWISSSNISLYLSLHPTLYLALSLSLCTAHFSIFCSCKTVLTGAYDEWSKTRTREDKWVKMAMRFQMVPPGFSVSAETTDGYEACLRTKTGKAIKNGGAITLFYNLKLKHAVEYECRRRSGSTCFCGIFKLYLFAWSVDLSCRFCHLMPSTTTEN